MKVGILLNKEMKNLPNLNKYKIERNKSKEKNKEIEQILFFRNCKKFFKEMSMRKTIGNINNNIISPPKYCNSKKLNTTIDLPLIIIPNLNLDKININEAKKQENNLLKKAKIPNSSRLVKNLNQEEKVKIKSNTAQKRKKSKNIFMQRYNKRFKLYEKTLNNLRKPLFSQKFKYDENTNNINIII